MTQAQIAEALTARNGFHVTRSAVSVALSRAGLTKRVRYSTTLPWTLQARHSDAYDAYMLRLAGRLEAERRRGAAVRVVETPAVRR